MEWMRLVHDFVIHACHWRTTHTTRTHNALMKCCDKTRCQSKRSNRVYFGQTESVSCTDVEQTKPLLFVRYVESTLRLFVEQNVFDCDRNKWYAIMLRIYVICNCINRFPMMTRQNLNDINFRFTSSKWPSICSTLNTSARHFVCVPQQQNALWRKISHFFNDIKLAR